MKRCWFHDWGKWKEVEKEFTVVLFKTGEKTSTRELWQRRVCKKCNYIQEEKISLWRR